MHNILQWRHHRGCISAGLAPENWIGLGLSRWLWTQFHVSDNCIRRIKYRKEIFVNSFKDLEARTKWTHFDIYIACNLLLLQRAWHTLLSNAYFLPKKYFACDNQSANQGKVCTKHCLPCAQWLHAASMLPCMGNCSKIWLLCSLKRNSPEFDQLHLPPNHVQHVEWDWQSAADWENNVNYFKLLVGSHMVECSCTLKKKLFESKDLVQQETGWEEHFFLTC